MKQRSKAKQDGLIFVDGVVPVGKGDLGNLRDDVWSFAMDQRAFGPRRLLVGFADVDGRFRGLAYTDRTTTLLVSFAACLDYLGKGAAAAVAFCDEPVTAGPLEPAFLERFAHAQRIAADVGIYLVDWIACDDDQFRAARLTTLTVREQPDWWDVQPAS